MKTTKYVLSLIFTAAALAVPVKADIVTTTTYKGKTMYVDVIPSGSNAAVWFRVQRNACSNGDVHVANLSRSALTVKKNVTVKSVAATLCNVKETYDNLKTVAGCGAVIGSGVCLAASAPIGETTAIMCSVMLDYAIDKGAKDCFFGVSNKVAEWLAGQSNWAAFAAGYKVGTKQWGDAVDHAIDLACTFVK